MQTKTTAACHIFIYFQTFADILSYSPSSRNQYLVTKRSRWASSALMVLTTTLRFADAVTATASSMRMNIGMLSVPDRTMDSSRRPRRWFPASRMVVSQSGKPLRHAWIEWGGEIGNDLIGKCSFHNQHWHTLVKSVFFEMATTTASSGRRPYIR